MRIVVQKFGGTSVVTPAARRNVTARIREALAEGLHVVAVVSAMGRAGDPYATDTLLGLLGDDGGAEADPRERDLLAACGEIIACVVLAHTLRAEGVPAAALTGREAGIITDDIRRRAGPSPARAGPLVGGAVVADSRRDRRRPLTTPCGSDTTPPCWSGLGAERIEFSRTCRGCSPRIRAWCRTRCC